MNHVAAPSAVTPSTAPSAGGSGSGSSSTRRTVSGSTVQTRYGPVQVQLTLDGSKITAARALRAPDGDPRSQQINSTAIPTLVQETVDAQSVHIDTVSGATYTSEGYISSLQNALDQAAHG
ncbi:FMN-binding protein [Streptomyces sp. 142MFCol3.1]|uniref:FMN-binding protein n=1 Tax=Streptomyces sp. 142MFCol3.1 TaxID=1172179 RepID=UPI002D21C540|nr:FMN-binding protein [Streptomyces sp. 142MFCol3.1]